MSLPQPALIPVGENRWRLTEDYACEWTHGGIRRRITVKAGFETDLASVPRPLWGFGLPPDGLHRAAAVIHDALYMARGRMPTGYLLYEELSGGQWARHLARYTREEADRLFGRLMREAGVPRWRRRLMYRAVRLVSWAFW